MRGTTLSGEQSASPGSMDGPRGRVKAFDVKGKHSNRSVEAYELTGMFSTETKEHRSIALLFVKNNSSYTNNGTY